MYPTFLFVDLAGYWIEGELDVFLVIFIQYI